MAGRMTVMGFRLLRGLVGLGLVVPLAGCISFRGVHSIPKLEGMVVDMETGEPVEGVVVHMGYCFANTNPLELLSPDGAPDTTGGGPRAEVTTGADGHFELPGYWGPEGSCGASWGAYRKGYMPLRFSYAASRKTKEVWFSWNRDDTSWRRNLEYRWEGRHVFVTVSLEPVKGTDPELWEKYLRTLKTYHPYDLLDEAYRYVSEGGELTEGIAKLIWRELMPCGESPRWSDGRTVAISRSIVRYCEGSPGDRICQSYSVRWARTYLRERALEGKEEGQ